MKDQLLKILDHYGKSATKFSDEIGVQRSSISHIISGRNQPSYDFILKIMKKYPELNVEWLLTGRGTMLKEYKEESETEKEETKNIFGVKDVQKLSGKILKNETIVQSKADIVDQSSGRAEIKENGNEKVTNVNNITKIIFFYKNRTFREYDPDS